MELTATAKVRTAEDEAESLKKDLGDVKGELEAAQEEGAKAKDSALREADEALQESRRIQDLNSQLASRTAEAQTNKERADKLARSQSQLYEQRDQAETQLEARSQEAHEARSKVSELETSVGQATAELQKVRTENAEMRSQASELLDARQRAEELGSEVSSLQAEATRSSGQNKMLSAQLQTLQELKDRYEDENEQARNESTTWHSKADELLQEVESGRSRLREAEAQRTDALHRAQEASKREDAYFDDNSHLQMQNDQLSQQLHDALSSANQSSKELLSLRSEVERLKVAKAQDQENSHAAWVEVENEVMQYRRDGQAAVALAKDLQAELAKARSVLTDKQRATLGLPRGPVAGANLQGLPV